MYDTSEFRKGLYIQMDGVPYQIVEFQHVKPGKGNAFVRTRVRNLLNGNVIERTLKSGEKVDEPALEHKRMQYLYKDSAGYQFMDLDSYEQTVLEEEAVTEKKFYLIENLEIEVLYFQGRPIDVDIPNFIEVRVKETEPGIKGDTASGGGKPAKMTTGLVVQVPFHIKENDLLKIDTRSGEYVEKLKG
ncbi:MAG: elongation factor P [Deltaproteobacteria bacterium]|nr:elongation factor P [Deltaproteobacteria bacterium]MBI3294356.1 elongation factor P [Deltaproteobacteria bacterium]